MSRGKDGGGEGREVDRRTFLDLGFLHFVVEGLLEVSFVTVGQLVNVGLRLSLIHCHAVFGRKKDPM